MTAELQFVNPRGLAEFKTFSQVATVHGGKTIYISGQVSWNEKGEVALAAVGATFDNVIKFTTYVVDLKPQDRVTISEVRSRHITSPRPPAGTMVGVQSLVSEGLLLEVEAVAVVD
jgi:enamine deaminase RidA (YjgF/YER057c/UK114 family)